MVTFLSACFGGKQALAPLKDGKEKIKVVYRNERQFNEDYGQFFSVKYPNIDVEVIPIMSGDHPLNFYGVEKEDEERVKEIIEQHKPDVLLLNEDLLTSYAQEGKLYSLDEVIVQDQFDLTGYMPGLIDSLRAKGKGKLYGLIPSLEAAVLYYNRDLFTENNIEFPRNQMTWEEVFNLSKRFQGIGTGKNKVYGLYQMSLSEISNAWFFYDVAKTSPLRMFDAKAKKFLIHTDGWKKVFELTTDAIRSQAVSFYDPNGDVANFLAFQSGKAAMTISNSWIIPELENPRSFNGQPAKKINWDIVTVPIDPQNPDESAEVRFGGIYAVSANSPNKRAAWEFVKFANGTEMEKISSRSTGKPFPTRNQVFKELHGRSVEPFYKLKPMVYSSDVLSHVNVPEEFYRLYTPLLEDTLRAIVDNKITVDEALAELQVKGQNALEQARAAKKREDNSKTAE
ncbi:periplasmic component [Paenibacillus popilliae ATCC 14706]|uniref:Periplasmic component n=2 Tax=Paenibacillus popilliae TaxID=78057 RepID=M9M597_PAEPP|nr:periplasmic component [Paenibacillus popilliae ATCC 14706]